MIEPVSVVDVDAAPKHDIHLESVDGGGARSVCSCGKYQSRVASTRREAHQLGLAHAAYKLKMWRRSL